MDTNEFLTIVMAACSGLRQNGYLLDAASLNVQPTYTSVTIPGRNWIITFTCDLRDDTVDCDVRRAGEPASADRPLFGFLVDNFHYRGGRGRAAPAHEAFDAKVCRLVREHVSSLERDATPVWQDKPIGSPAPG